MSVGRWEGGKVVMGGACDVGDMTTSVATGSHSADTEDAEEQCVFFNGHITTY